MKKEDFEKLPKEPSKIEIGEKFLLDNFYVQKDFKEIGTYVSYYEIININPDTKSYEYMMKYDVLE